MFVCLCVYVGLHGSINIKKEVENNLQLSQRNDCLFPRLAQRACAHLMRLVASSCEDHMIFVAVVDRRVSSIRLLLCVLHQRAISLALSLAD